MPDTRTPTLRRVRVVDRGDGHRGYVAPVVRTVELDWVCPRCGGPRGEPAAFNFHDDGEWLTTDRWMNECGHVDLYRDLLVEARARAAASATTDVPQQPVDADTARLLGSIAGDPARAQDRATIVAAINADALAHDGQVDPNRVRDALRSGAGLSVPSRLIGAVYSGLARAGHLVPDGWTTSTDAAGHNAGKPLRLYRMAPPGGAR